MKKTILGIILFFILFISVRADYIYYTPGEVYRKTTDGSDFGINLTPTGGYDAVNSVILSPNGNYIYYISNTDGNKIYKKNANDTNNGSAINSNNSSNVVISPDGNYLYYENHTDGNKIYKKSANDTSNGSAITSVGSNTYYYKNLEISPDGNYLYYTNSSDGNKIYKKSANDSLNGSTITSVGSIGFITSPDGNYLYYINSTNQYIYKKSANDSLNGSAINSLITNGLITSPDGNYLYYTYDDGMLCNNSCGSEIYKKSANDTSNGTNLFAPGVGTPYFFMTYVSTSVLDVNGSCGTANKTYSYGNTTYGTDTLCSTGNPTPTTPSFPGVGSSVNWTCVGSGLGTTANCSASQNSNSNYKNTLGLSHILYSSTTFDFIEYNPGTNQVHINGGNGISCPSDLSSVLQSSNSSIIIFGCGNGNFYSFTSGSTGAIIGGIGLNPYCMGPTDNTLVYYPDQIIRVGGYGLCSSRGISFINGATWTSSTSSPPGGFSWSPPSPIYTWSSSLKGLGESNGNYTHYILNRLTATEGNMQQANNSAGSTAFSNSTQVKSNFLANYSYMQSWYESKGLTMDVINNNVDWNNGVTFSKTDVAGGMLNGYKLSAHYPFLSYKETDNTDSTVFWRTNLESTSFQTDTTWTNVGVPAYPIRNGSGGIIAYLEFPCGNLICKDQYCSDVKKITNINVVSPINLTVFANPGNGLPYCGDGIKNTMDEECDINDGIRHDLGETCNSQCKVVVSGNTPGCPTYSALGFTCSNTTPVPIFASAPVNQPPVPTYSGFGTDKNTLKSDTLTATDNENDTLAFAKFSDPAHGTLNVLVNGSFIYTPSLNYIGNDSFFYSVSDGTNGAVTQEVTIVVNDVVIGNNPPVPTFSSLSVNMNGTYSNNLTATDTENDTLTYLSAVNPLHGTLNINSNGSFDYTPDSSYSGNDTFTYAVSDGHNLPVEKVVTITVNGVGNSSSGSIINWTPPVSINIGDINTNTGMTDTEETISDDVVCNSTDNGTSLNKSIIVTNTMADTTFLKGLKGKEAFIKTLSGSSTEVAEKIIQKKLKAEKLNVKSSTYDLGTKGTVSGIQFNLSKIPNSAVMRKLVNLAIDHSSTTMADYEQTIVDSCNGTITSTGNMVVPAGFIDVNEKGETMLNLFRYNGN